MSESLPIQPPEPNMITPYIRDELWVEDAACKGTSENFFTEVKDTLRGMRTSERLVEENRLISTYCGRCIVRQDCLARSLRDNDKFGIWGGLSEQELIPIRATMKQHGKITLEQWNAMHDYRTEDILDDTFTESEAQPFLSSLPTQVKAARVPDDLEILESSLRAKLHMMEKLATLPGQEAKKQLATIEADIRTLEIKIASIL